METAICQIKAVPDKEANISKAALMIDRAAAKKARIVVLPEMCNCLYQPELFLEAAENVEGGATVTMLSEKAGEHGILLIAGSIPEKVPDEPKVYNTCFVFGPDGALIARHRKLHLFDVSISGKITVTESEIVKPGNELTLFDALGMKFGIAICYDIRFPELARLLALEGAQIIAVPAAFNTTTGPPHWHPTMRARAIENQVYIAAVCPARNTDSSYHTYGHSMIVDPWGKILAEAGEDEQIIFADIDMAYLEKVRRELPLFKHRRTDLYGLEEIV